MADNKPINWAYPFKAAGESSKEISDPQVYFDALAKAENGFYPMGANGLWHGGVHFDKGTAAVLDQTEVRCIADGEVIAYRIDEKYPETQYAVVKPGSGPEPVDAKYSTGFVLVKHRLVLPPAPPPPPPTGETTTTTADKAAPASSTAPAATPSATETTPTASESEALTFYSLYMHLLDCTGYQAQPTLKRPGFWGAGLYKVKADAPDKVLGLNVREHHKVAKTDKDYTKYQNKLTTLPRGTTIETGEAAPSPDHNWRKLVRVTPAVAGLAENTGWVYVIEAKKLTENSYLVSENDSTDVPALEQIGLHVREAANGSSNVLAVLPRGTEIKVSQEGASGKYLKLESIISGNAVPPLTADAEGNLPGYVWLDSLESQQTPNTLAKDAVYVLPQGHSIKAGELIGHLGVYQDYNQGEPQPRLHLEVFSCDDVPAFIEKSKARAETLPDAQKTLIKVSKGSKIIQPAAADGQIETGADVRICSDSPKIGRWAKVQKYVTCNAQKTTELGSFNSSNFAYPLSAAQKTTLAARMGIEAADMPDKVDFLKVSFSSVEGGDPLPYVQGTSVPQTHLWRKIGAAVGEPLWVERAKLDAQGQRTSTADALSAWSEFPLHTRIEGQPCGYARILPAASWDGLPNERKAIDPGKVNWWHVTVGDLNGNDISGWAAEKDLIVSRHSPWEWPGFSTIQETTSPADLHARSLVAEGRATPEESTQLKGRADAAEQGPILQKLHGIIDQSNETGTRDGLLTGDEFRAALGKPWLAQQLALLIAKYESEWFPNKAKWDALDAHMADDLADWNKEKERIDKLCWWKPIFPETAGEVWHINPVGPIGFFSRKRHPIINLHGQSVELEFLNMYEGGELSDSDLRSAASDLNCEPGLIYAIAKQESAHSSFIVVDGETIPSILYERHWFKKKAQNPLFGETHPEIYGSAYKRARRDKSGKYISTATGAEVPITEVYGPTGRFQYERLITAYRLNEDAALQACSWGKFQIMGFNYAAAGFDNVKDFAAAMSLGDPEHIKAFLKFAKSNATLLRGLREKNFELIAEGHNGSGWKSINPDYAGNIEKFYNEYSNAK